MQNSVAATVLERYVRNKLDTCTEKPEKWFGTTQLSCDDIILLF